MRKAWVKGGRRLIRRRRLLQSAHLGVVVTALIAVGLPSIAQADFEFSPPIPLAGPPAAAPDLATDAEGHTTIVWQEGSEDGITRLIQAARLAPDGTLGSLQTLTSMTSGPGCSCPKVVIDSQRRATVAWVAGVDPSDRDRMQAVQLGADGLPLGPVKTLSPTGEEASRHDLAVDSQGRATVVWRVGGPIARIESARLLPDGTAEPAQTISEPGVDSTAPSVAIGQEDRAAMAWDSTDGLQLIRISAGGSPGSVQTVLPPEASAGVPQIVVDSQDRTTLAYWRSSGFEAKAVRVEPDGTVGPIVNLSAEGEKTLVPLVAIDSTDRITAVWESFSGQIKTARIEADGTVGPMRLVSDPDLHRAGEPQLAMGPGGKAVVIWAHSPPTFIEPLPAPECEEGFEPQSDVVQAAFIGADGLPGPIHSISRFGEQSIIPAVAADPSGRVTVVWHSFDGTYFCSDVDVRLQMGWGPWSEINEPPPEDIGPVEAGEREPPGATASTRLGKRATVRGRFLAVRGACRGAPGSSCESTIKLLAPTKRLIASGQFHLENGTKRTLRLRLSRHGRGLLARRSPRTVRATVEGVAVENGIVAISRRPPGGRLDRRSQRFK